jgi:hypothetical protein
MNNDVEPAFPAAEAAGTLPLGFLRGVAAQRVLANYQARYAINLCIRDRCRSPA